MSKFGESRGRVATLAVVIAVLGATLVAAPSFGGPSFLTKKSAARIYLPKQKANKLFVRKDRAPLQTEIAVGSSTSTFGPVSSTTPVEIPGTPVPFDLQFDGYVVLTLSGNSLCRASTTGRACPVSIQVDGQRVAFANLDVSSSLNPPPAPSAQTFVSTAVLSPGRHTASVQYAGSSDPTVQFSLTGYSLIVEAYPDSLE